MPILRRPEHFWPALWIAVVAILGAVIALEHIVGRVKVGEGPRAPAKIVEARLLPAFTLPAAGQEATETVARPLFVPTRRLSPPAAAAAVATMKKGQFVLTGVTVIPGASFVFLKEVGTGKTQSVKMGAMVNGMTVETVEPRRVVLKQGEESEDLTLNIQVPARVASAPVLPGAVPPAPGADAPPAARRPTPTVGAMPQASPPVPGAAPVPMPAPAAASSATPATPAPATGRRRPWINAQ